MFYAAVKALATVLATATYSESINTAIFFLSPINGLLSVITYQNIFILKKRKYIKYNAESQNIHFTRR